MVFANIFYYEQGEVFSTVFLNCDPIKFKLGNHIMTNSEFHEKKCFAAKLSYLAQKSVYFRDVLIVKYGFICIRKTEIMTNFALPNLEWESIGNNNR